MVKKIFFGVAAASAIFSANSLADGGLTLENLTNTIPVITVTCAGKTGLPLIKGLKVGPLAWSFLSSQYGNNFSCHFYNGSTEVASANVEINNNQGALNEVMVSAQGVKVDMGDYTAGTKSNPKYADNISATVEPSS